MAVPGTIYCSFLFQSRSPVRADMICGLQYFLLLLFCFRGHKFENGFFLFVCLLASLVGVKTFFISVKFLECIFQGRETSCVLDLVSQ